MPRGGPKPCTGTRQNSRVALKKCHAGVFFVSPSRAINACVPGTMRFFSVIENFKFYYIYFSGISDVLSPYTAAFEEAEIDGPRLLCGFNHHDLAKLGVTKLGHQELILEAIELLIKLVRDHLHNL